MLEIRKQSQMAVSWFFLFYFWNQLYLLKVLFWFFFFFFFNGCSAKYTVYNDMLICFQVPPGWGGIGQVGMTPGPASSYSQNPSQVPADTESRVPVINLKDGTRLAGDDAPRRKELEQWLKENPGFVADTGAFICVSVPRASNSSCLLKRDNSWLTKIIDI